MNLTLATPNLARKVSGWKMLDEESLSDHFYIVFNVRLGAENNAAQNSRSSKIDFKKLESALTTESFNQVSSCKEAEEKALALTVAIHACCNVTPAGKGARKSVHWWTPVIGILRKTANHLRRVFQRKRKRAGSVDSATEAENAKATKRNLVHAIKRAKDDAWRKL